MARKWKFSRFTRKREHAAAFKSMLRHKGVRGVSITGHADGSPTGNLMEAIIESVDEFDSVIQALLDAGADINARNKDGLAPAPGEGREKFSRKQVARRGGRSLKQPALARQHSIESDWTSTARTSESRCQHGAGGQ